MKKIYYNGKFYTMDEKNSIAEAILVEEDKIKALGNKEEILYQKDENTELVDLKGRLVVPGFNDSHMHLLPYGKSLSEVNLNGAKSIEEVIHRGERFLLENPNVRWLMGAGWDHEIFKEGRILTRYDLDKISTDIPIMFSRTCHHISVCNTKALELADITLDTIVENGEIEVKNGEITGVLKENATRLLRRITGDLSKEEKKDHIVKGMDKLVSLGLTTIQSDDILENNFNEIIGIYKELESEGKMKLRVYQQCRMEDPNELRKLMDEANSKGSGIDYKMGPLKLFMDGSLGGGTAYMNEPYEDDKGTLGIPNYSEETIDSIVMNAHHNNIPVAVHAIGDRAIDMVISAVEKAQKKNPKEDIRHSIIHCQITSKEALDRIVENNIIANVQPIFLNSDINIVEKRVGKERAKYSYNWKTLMDRGTLVTFGTDCPIETPNPLKNIYSAVNRCSLEGVPEGGWLPEEKFTVLESVRAYTINSAAGVYGENIIGSMEIGKYADMTVLSHDIFEIDPLEIKDVECVMTIKGGEIVFER